MIKTKRLLAAAALILLVTIPVAAQSTSVTPEMVRAEFLHAWKGYKQYAWGHDDLAPLGKKYHDWHKSSLLMTPVDAFDTMELMGLTKEADEAKALILKQLDFNKDMEVQSFEITIRLLGGLLSAYENDGDKKFLALAEDLGKRLLPVFNSATGMPYRYVNLVTGKIRDSINNPAEIGTALIEFGTLSKLTGNPVYYDKAKKALVSCFNHRSKIGLVGTWINVETGEWTDKSSHISGAIDSYYEYLFKASVLFGDKDCKMMWDSSLTAINKYLAETAHGGLWYGQAQMDSGQINGTRFGALDAFFPAVLAMSGDIEKAKLLEDNAFKMWNLYGIEPEEIDYTTMKVTYPAYVLRPEVIESAYYLYHYTHDPKYLKMGETFYNDLVKYCRTDDAYAALKDVTTHEKRDQMQSFFLAETMKYLYLLISEDKAIDFDKVVFNTEAHPMKR